MDIDKCVACVQLQWRRAEKRSK